MGNLETHTAWSALWKQAAKEQRGLKKATQRLMKRAIETREKRISKLLAERGALLAQLPDEMKHCTIRFIECEKGHGRLTADNWIDHGCKKCQLDALEAERDALWREVEEARAECETATKAAIVLRDEVATLDSRLWDYKFAMRHQREELATLRAERDALRAALEAVEWETDTYVEDCRDDIRDPTYCPWCGNMKTEDHAPDCQRQQALGLERER
jgi:cobalamin biosynthesis protein CobT